MGPRTSLDEVEWRKFLPLLRLELRPSVRQSSSKLLLDDDDKIITPTTLITIHSSESLCSEITQQSHTGNLAVSITNQIYYDFKNCVIILELVRSKSGKGIIILVNIHGRLTQLEQSRALFSNLIRPRKIFRLETFLRNL